MTIPTDLAVQSQPTPTQSVEMEVLTARQKPTNDAVAARVQKMVAGLPAQTYVPETAVQPLNVGFFQLEAMRSQADGPKLKDKQRNELRQEN